MSLFFIPRLRRRIIWACALSALSAAASAQQMALTFDDGFAPGDAPALVAALNQATLDTLATYGVRAMLFPAGAQVDSDTGLALVRAWGEAGHRIGNHSYQHQAYSATDFDTYTQDLTLAQQRFSTMPGWCARLRLPYLDEGRLPAQQQALRHWLAQHGYGIAPATITLADWEDNAIYEQSLAQGDQPAADAFRQAYVTRLLNLAAQQHEHWQQVLQGRDPAHVMLLHANRLNSDALPILLPALQQNGWRFIDPEQAFQDPIYQRSLVQAAAPDAMLPAPVCGP